jgi:hypothetical protein
MDQQHEMVIDITHSTGAEEWLCPTCGRRMAIIWHPWKKIVLEQGDIYAAHSASKGGLRLGPVSVIQGNEVEQPASPEPSVEDPYLAPWMQWLENVDLDNLGNGEN